MPCWEARWYEAHGYSQVDDEWTFTGSYRFWDADALHEFVRDTRQHTLPLFDDSSPTNFPLDAVGWRVEGTLGFIIGVDVNLDVIYNLDQQQLNFGPNGWEFRPGDLDVYFSPGGQVLTFGGGVSTGFLFLFNLPENDRVTEWGWNAGGTVLAEAGGEFNVFGSLSEEEYPEGKPWGFYIGGGTGDELSVFGGGSYTWKITEPVVNFLRRLSAQ
jgi:hypothetical protein